jgi:hypothetical protein
MIDSSCVPRSVACSSTGSPLSSVTDSRSHIGSMRDDPGGYAARVVAFFWQHLDREVAASEA